jgi:hypothetical protein
VKSIRFPTTPSRPNLLDRAELVRKFNLATPRVLGLRQSVIGGHLLRCSHRQRRAFDWGETGHGYAAPFISMMLRSGARVRAEFTAVGFDAAFTGL